MRNQDGGLDPTSRAASEADGDDAADLGREALKLLREVSTLRTKSKVKVIRRALREACNRGQFRITDWSIQDDHLHLVCEAKDATALSRGLQGFNVRVAKGLNKLLGRRGRVFADRYHSRILKTPREVRNALAYVLLNARHHGKGLLPYEPDPFSSWASFDGWRFAPSGLGDSGVGETGPPHSWLRRTGWRRHGLLDLNEAPGGHR